MKFLIVNADDYGLTPGVSQGIREAHRNGIVTSSTAMMNMPDAEPALRAAAVECPNLGLGVHLTLTAGRPLLPPSQVASLVDNDGRFLKPPALYTRAASIDAAQVRDEWRAQIERFCAATGRQPDHLDSHHHTAYELPGCFEAMLELAAEYRCPIRSPFPDIPGERQVEPEEDYDDLVERAKGLLDKHGVRHPDHMSIGFYDETATLEHFLALVASLPDGVTEFMTHPGHSDELLMASSSYNRQRERELEILTSAQVKAALQELGIELLNFGDL